MNNSFSIKKTNSFTSSDLLPYKRAIDAHQWHDLHRLLTTGTNPQNPQELFTYLTRHIPKDQKSSLHEMVINAARKFFSEPQKVAPIQLLALESIDRRPFLRVMLSYLGDEGANNLKQAFRFPTTFQPLISPSNFEYAFSRGINVEGILTLFKWMSSPKDAFIKKDDTFEYDRYLKKALSHLNENEKFYLLDELSKDQDPCIFYSVADALGEIGGEKAAEILLRMEENCDSFKNRHVCQVLQKVFFSIKGEGALSFFKRMSEHPNGLIRENLAFALGERSGKGFLRILDKMSEDHDSRVLCGVVKSLSLISSSESRVKALETLLEMAKQDWKQRERLTTLFFNIEGSWVLDFLSRLSTHSDEYIRMVAAIVLGKRNEDRALKILEEMSRDENPRVLVEVAHSLSLSQPDKALSILDSFPIEVVKDQLISKNIFKLLKRIGGDKALGILQKISENYVIPPVDLVCAIATIGGDRAIDSLEKFSKNDKDSFIHKEVLKSLSYIGGERAWDILMSFSQSNSWIIRERLANVCGCSGGKRALLALKEMLKEEDTVMCAIIQSIARKFSNFSLNDLIEESNDSNSLVRYRVIVEILKRDNVDPKICEQVQEIILSSYGYGIHMLPDFDLKEACDFLIRNFSQSLPVMKLKEIIKKTPYDIEGILLNLFLLLKGPWVAGFFSRLSDHPDVSLRKIVTRAIAQLDFQGSQYLLEKMCKDKEFSVRCTAAVTLLKSNPTKAREILNAVIKKNEISKLQTLFWVLKKVSAGDEVFELLMTLSKHTEITIASEAVEYLSHLGGDRVIVEFKSMLFKRKRQWIFHCIVKSLPLLLSNQSLSDLIKRLEDDLLFVRYLASKELLKRDLTGLDLDTCKRIQRSILSVYRENPEPKATRLMKEFYRSIKFDNDIGEIAIFFLRNFSKVSAIKEIEEILSEESKNKLVKEMEIVSSQRMGHLIRIDHLCKNYLNRKAFLQNQRTI